MISCKSVVLSSGGTSGVTMAQDKEEEAGQLVRHSPRSGLLI
jgi:hypothetical protein